MDFETWLADAWAYIYEKWANEEEFTTLEDFVRFNYPVAWAEWKHYGQEVPMCIIITQGE